MLNNNTVAIDLSGLVIFDKNSPKRCNTPWRKLFYGMESPSQVIDVSVFTGIYLIGYRFLPNDSTIIQWSIIFSLQDGGFHSFEWSRILVYEVKEACIRKLAHRHKTSQNLKYNTHGQKVQQYNTCLTGHGGIRNLLPLFGREHNSVYFRVWSLFCCQPVILGVHVWYQNDGQYSKPWAGMSFLEQRWKLWVKPGVARHQSTVDFRDRKLQILTIVPMSKSLWLHSHILC